MKSLSIHPRNHGFPRDQKSNTAKPSKNRPRYVKRVKEYDRRQRNHAATLESLPSSTNPASFRKPGSWQI